MIFRFSLYIFQMKFLLKNYFSENHKDRLEQSAGVDFK